MKRIAFMFYGQPRSIAQGMAWKNELIKNIKKEIDIEVDFYYHFWDAISPSPVVVGKNHPWANAIKEKRPIIPSYNWMNDLIRIHPSEIYSQLQEVHDLYGYGPVNIDLTKSYIEHADLWYKNNVMPRIKEYAKKAHPDIQEQVIERASDWWAYSGANSTLSMFSSGYTYDLIAKSEIKYDLIVRSRMDMILYPFNDNEWSPAAKIIKMINDSENVFPNYFNDPNQKSHHIEVSGLEFHSADTGIANADYMQYLGHSGLHAWYDDWQNELAKYLALRIFNFSLHNISGYGSELAPNVHNVYLEFKRTIDKRNDFLIFATRFQIAPEILIRRSLDDLVDWMDVSTETWKRIEETHHIGAADTNEIFRINRGF